MGTIPAPNIFQDAAQIAQTPQNAMAEYARVAALKQQTAQSQVATQGQQIQNQQAQLDLQDSQNAHTLGPQFLQKDQNGKITGFDNEGYYNALIGSGMNPAKVMALKNQQLTYQQGLAKLGKDQLDLQNQKNDDAYQIVEPIRQLAQDPNADLGRLNDVYLSVAPKLIQLGLDPKTLPAGFKSAQDAAAKLQDFETELGQHKQLLADVKTGAETAQKSAEARQQNATAAHQEWQNNLTKNTKSSDSYPVIDAIYPPNDLQTGQLNRSIKMQVDQLWAQGKPDEANKVIDQASQNVQGVAKDVAVQTNPAVQNAKVALAARTKRAEQVITQGDPEAAGKLLADGSLTLSELKSRGTTPEFIVQATNAAQKANPAFNPQKAEADLAVAKSPANLAFFGSAKSLTDKAGTLDQLEAAAKDIPDGQIPIFNNIADVMKAATGSGPVAKYASILMGVADDYSKVMGGGQGSDTSRNQALNLAPVQASPEARHAAVEGIRGAVGSQINSRIGGNTILQRMYGQGQQQQTQQQTPQMKVGQSLTLKDGRTVKVTAVHPDGTFDAQ